MYTNNFIRFFVYTLCGSVVSFSSSELCKVSTVRISLRNPVRHLFFLILIKIACITFAAQLGNVRWRHFAKQ